MPKLAYFPNIVNSWRSLIFKIIREVCKCKSVRRRTVSIFHSTCESCELLNSIFHVVFVLCDSRLWTTSSREDYYLPIFISVNNGVSKLCSETTSAYRTSSRRSDRLDAKWIYLYSSLIQWGMIFRYRWTFQRYLLETISLDLNRALPLIAVFHRVSLSIIESVNQYF